MSNIFKKILFIFSIFVFTQNLIANEQIDVKNKLLDKMDKIIIIVQNKNIPISKRNNKIIDLLTPTFDFELMAKLSLGKKAWKELNAENKKKFTKLYVKRMEKSYSSKLDKYSNEVVEVKEIQQPKKNRIYLITDLVNNNKKLEIIYKYYKPKNQKLNKDNWLIYDVEILGVSILKTDKAQFKEFLQTNTIYALMEVISK
ncbi:MAG: ABC transporter substrate-binding protein [Sulfurimonas sp.]|nr:ABC transporter substrate-binding protein [Sulfurimonas sp.]